MQVSTVVYTYFALAFLAGSSSGRFQQGLVLAGSGSYWFRFLVPGSVRTCADMVNMLVLYANRVRVMQQCDFAGLNVYRIMFLGVRGNCVCVCVLCACLVVVVVGWSGVDVVPVCDALEDE